MREMITVFVCVAIFFALLQTKVVRMGMDVSAQEKMSESLKRANQRFKNVLAAAGVKNFSQTENASLAVGPIRAQSAKALEEEIRQGVVLIEGSQQSLRLRIPADYLFSGPTSAALRASGRRVLQKIGGLLFSLPDVPVQVEAYSEPDSASVDSPDAWRWSSEQAAAVAGFLQTKAGLDPTRISATGLGPFRPWRPLTGERNRYWNRRLELVLNPLGIEAVQTARRLKGYVPPTMPGQNKSEAAEAAGVDFEPGYEKISNEDAEPEAAQPAQPDHEKPGKVTVDFEAGYEQPANR
jgi:flagellar motor protein MotB